MRKIKLSEWAKENAVCYRTAWNYYKSGKFGEKCIISDTGSVFILVDDEENPKNGQVEIYARVSSSEKKQDLNSQAELCEQFCIQKGWAVNKVYKEVASGMNDNRPKLNKILENPPEFLVVLYKDRLTRFGFNYVQKLLSAKKCKVIVINENESKQEDLLKDFISLVTSFCCRLYGARRGQAKALKIKENLKND